MSWMFAKDSLRRSKRRSNTSWQRWNGFRVPWPNILQNIRRCSFAIAKLRPNFERRVHHGAGDDGPGLPIQKMDHRDYRQSCTTTANRHGHDAMARRLAPRALPTPGRGAAAAAPAAQSARADRADRAALEDPLLVAKSLQALARRRSSNLGAWKGHLQRAQQVAFMADAQAAARVLNACSRSPLPELANEVAEAYQDRARRLLGQSSARQLATAANAMARMLIRDEDYIMRLSRELRMKFEKCNTFQASLIANSYVRLMVVERTLFGQLLPAYAKTHGHRFRVKDLALVLHAYAKAQLRSTAVFESLKHPWKALRIL
eukprot:s2034_g1.t1